MKIYRGYIVAITIGLLMTVWFADDLYIKIADDPTKVLSGAINPNTATIESLSRLSGIGPDRAKKIIEYRQASGLGQQTYMMPDDLKKIKGIGPKTVEKIEKYLVFD